MESCTAIDGFLEIDVFIYGFFYLEDMIPLVVFLHIK